MRNAAPRAAIETDLGKEILCAKCGEYWPEDKEFFYFMNGKPHSCCKACYLNSQREINKACDLKQREANTV